MCMFTARRRHRRGRSVAETPTTQSLRRAAHRVVTAAARGHEWRDVSRSFLPWLHSYIYIYIYTCIIHGIASARIFLPREIHSYTCMCIYIYIYVYIYIYTYLCIWIWIRSFSTFRINRYFGTFEVWGPGKSDFSAENDSSWDTQCVWVLKI